MIIEKKIEVSYPQNDVINSRANLILFLAGQGSGKSHIAGVISYTLVKMFPHIRGIIAANTYGQLNKSTMFRIREVWKEYFGATEYTEKNPQGNYVISRHPPAHFETKSHNYDNYNNIISFQNGCVVYIYSLDAYKNIEGSEVGWAMLDETKDTKEEAVKEVITGRVRQGGIYVNNQGALTSEPTDTPFNPIYLFTSPAKVKWLNDWFELDKYESEILQKIYSYPDYFSKKIDNKHIVICPTHFNARNLAKNFVSNRLKNISQKLADKVVFGNPFAQAGGEFYKSFNRSYHVPSTPIPYNSNKPLHITFDFNKHPYVTICIWQVYELEGRIVAVQIDEIIGEPPNNSTSDACGLFKKKYPLHKTGLFVYGDPSGKQQDTRAKGGRNDFSIIKSSLKTYNPRFKVAKSAPNIVQRSNFINSIFEKQVFGISIVINPNCTKTIADYIYLKEDSEGHKLKKKKTDDETGISYEEFGHTSDANDYFICKYFLIYYNKFKAGKYHEKVENDDFEDD